MSRVTLVDPLTLLGRELLSLLPESSIGSDIACVHTTSDDEHQIGEIGGEALLIPPLDSRDDLAGTSILVVCSDLPGERFRHVVDFVTDSPDVAVIDLARVDALAALTTPVADLPLPDTWPHRLRLAHPAVIAAATILRPLAHLRPRRLALAAFDPASSFGLKAFEAVARQAAARLQGASVDDDDRVGGEVLAFNLVVRDPSDLLDEAAIVLGDVATTATLGLSGCFHGHFATLDITLDHSVDEVMLGELWSTEPDLQLGDLPARLDTVVGNDRVILTPPVVAAHGTSFTVTALLDGLRIGGAVTGLRLLEALVAEA